MNDELGRDAKGWEERFDIVKNLRLGNFRSLIVMRLRCNSNSGFAIRNFDGSDVVGSVGWVLGLASAHREECLCH